jgi:CubicO group peptidase (beta-lactamase class C family)
MTGSTVYEAVQPIPHRAMGYKRDAAWHIIASDQSLTSATKGDGGVYTSLTDYSKWICALQQNRLLHLADVLRRLRFPITGMHDSYYAAGWFESTDSPRLLFHSGSTCGFSNFVIQLPGDELTVVFFSNIADNSAPFQHIARIITECGLANIESVFPLHELTR